MTIQGTFYDIDDNAISVTITKSDGSNNTVTIGENGLYFSGDPISIETDMDSTFNPIIRKSCTINLLTRNYIGDYLWAENAHNIRVEVKRGNDTIFYGFVEPNTFSQPFVELDEFSINCIDVLSALQYYNYQDATMTTYPTLKATASTASFLDLITDSLGNALQDTVADCTILYDRSRGTSTARVSYIFQDLGISESYLFGETFDDIWTSEDIVSEVLQYLNLHIIQQGKTFYIFDWDTLKNKRNRWVNIQTNSNVSQSSPHNITITGDMHGANDTSITVSDVYNQISVKCGLENLETVISSPLDNDTLVDLYSNRQLYMREYISPADGNSRSIKAFCQMVMEKGETVTYDKAKYVDWYVRVKDNPNWFFHASGNNSVLDVMKNDDTVFVGGKYYNQWKFPNTIYQNRLWPAIISFGSVERMARVTDDSPAKKPSMTDYLYIPINGNETDDNTNAVPTDNELQSHAPIIEYLGGNGGVYSPADEDIINYLVFSGKILLQPKVKGRYWTGGNFTDLKTLLNQYEDADDIPVTSYSNVTFLSWAESADNEDGRYYTRKFFKLETPSDTVDETNYLAASLQPWTKDNGERLYHYEYSENEKNSEDLIAKLPILECELIIGNKRLIETNIDQYGHSTFQWVTIGQEPTFTYEDDGLTYPITTFTLGVNPKLDDYIIGTEFDLQDTVEINMNIDAKGTAIPITKSDNLTGAIQFRILGPINTTWNQITRRHPTWFRHTQWSSENKLILAHLENIIIKDFECKIYSNNAMTDTEGNDELIYVSDETTQYINKHDDTEFRFITQPTTDVIAAQGLAAGTNINAVINMVNDEPVGTIYNAATVETAKAEEHFVNQYYTEYHVPRIEMTMTVHNSSNINWRNNYLSNPLNKSFYVVAVNEDVRNNTSTIKLKSMDA